LPSARKLRWRKLYACNASALVAAIDAIRDLCVCSTLLMDSPTDF
jgi:hypothetical protein